MISARKKTKVHSVLLLATMLLVSSCATVTANVPAPKVHGYRFIGTLTALHPVPPSVDSINAISCPTESFCMGIASVPEGSSGNYRIYEVEWRINSGWQIPYNGLITTNGGPYNNNLSCATPVSCFAAATLPSSINENYVLVWHIPGWSMSSEVNSYMIATSCPVAETCFTVGYSGGLVKTLESGSPPTLSVWHPKSGMTIIGKPTALRSSPDSFPQSLSLSCPTTTWCMLVNSQVNLLQYPYVALSWHLGSGWSAPTTLPFKSTSSPKVACANDNFCMVIGINHALSWTRGTGWSKPVAIAPGGSRKVTGAGFDALSCPTVNFCFATNSIPSEVSIWCPPTHSLSSSLSCANSEVSQFFSGASGYILEWIRGKGWSLPKPIFGGNSKNGIPSSCPSDNFCMIADGPQIMEWHR